MSADLIDDEIKKGWLINEWMRCGRGLALRFPPNTRTWACCWLDGPDLTAPTGVRTDEKELVTDEGQDSVITHAVSVIGIRHHPSSSISWAREDDSDVSVWWESSTPPSPPKSCWGSNTSQCDTASTKPVQTNTTNTKTELVIIH